ncbi:MAG: penicillin-binding protein 2 [Betaproteobacteria bacterium]
MAWVSRRRKRRRSLNESMLSFGPRIGALRDTGQALAQLRIRLAVAAGFVLVCFGLLLARFVWLQVVKHEELHARAEANRTAQVPVTANRGLIKDRNGAIVARNYSAYTLEINPREVANLPALIDELATVIDIQPRDRRRFQKLREELKAADSIPIRTRLTEAEVARFAAHRYRFPQVEIKARLFRDYPLGPTAAHLLGYIGRVSARDQERIEKFKDPADYLGTEYIGKIGVEYSYEEDLHGTSGSAQVEITAGGRAVRTLRSTPAQPGANLMLAVDIGLQQVVEQAFGDRRGALIAIEPATGDILAFVSMPTFDPNLFVDGIDPKAWDELNNDPDKPLLNRALRGTYPIGSTYKPFMALAGLHLGKRKPETNIHDPGFFMLGDHKFRDSAKVPLGPVNLHRSIVVSSDVYYYTLAHELGVDAIHDFMKPFGFGQITGIDLDGEQTGILPSSEWKQRRFKQKWHAGETISIGIGQGYNAFTLLQLAQATAVLANRGVVMRPHVVRSVEDPATGDKRLTVPAESYRIDLKPEYMQVVIDAMVDVNVGGTGRRAFAGAPYKVAGKTGTAQVFTVKQNEKYDARKIDERLRDHSLFIAFAPAEAPKIALALLVENGGFGSEAAAPIARAALDYYLLGKLPADTPPVVAADAPPAAGRATP